MLKFHSLALGALLLFGAAHVQAQPDVSGRVSGLLDEAVDAYDGLQVQSALVKLQQATEIIEEFSVTSDDAALVYLMLGVIRHAESGDPNTALDPFIEAVRIRRDAQLPPYYTTPELEAVLAQALEWVPEEVAATDEPAPEDPANDPTETTAVVVSQGETTTDNALPEGDDPTPAGDEPAGAGDTGPATEVTSEAGEAEATPDDGAEVTDTTDAATETVDTTDDAESTPQEEGNGFTQAVTMESTLTASEAAPGGSVGDSLSPGAELTPQTVPYLWEYRGVSADWANFRPHTLSTRLEVGPTGLAGLSLGYNYLNPDAFNIASEVGVGTATGYDGEASWGPSYHMSLFGGYPLTDWRGSRTTRVIVGRAPVGMSDTGEIMVTTNYADVGVPAHRRVIVETGLTHGVTSFESTNRNTSLGLGLRYRIDWDFDIQIVDPGQEASHERHLAGGWAVATHVYPVTFSGRDGTTAGFGADLDATFPFLKRRDNPVLLALGGSYLPDESYTFRVGFNFTLRRW